MKGIMLKCIIFYRKVISPLITALWGNTCRFEPTCSSYAFQSVTRYGTIKGSVLALKRILRCNPFSKGGYDPVR